MFNALHYYWITTKGYRLRPWASPYIQWRVETFFGKEAADLDARKFFSLMWRERARMRRFWLGSPNAAKPKPVLGINFGAAVPWHSAGYATTRELTMNIVQCC